MPIDSINTINYTKRLDSAIRIAAWAHEQQKQHRKGGDIPFIIHPFSVMLIASSVTNDEDVLIACLFHDILEDVDSKIYNEQKMQNEFGSRVVAIVKDVTNDLELKDWYERNRAYLFHLEHQASDESVIVSASDKIQNLLSVLIDYETHGNELWQLFTTKSSKDQLWWYQAVLDVIRRRNGPKPLIDKLANEVEALKQIININ